MERGSAHNAGSNKSGASRGLVGAFALALVLVCLAALLAALFPSSHASGGPDTGSRVYPTVDSLKRAIVADPTNVDAYLRLAEIYANAQPRDLDAAAATLRGAVMAVPDDPRPYLQLATVELLLGHSKTASTALEQYRRLSVDEN